MHRKNSDPFEIESLFQLQSQEEQFNQELFNEDNLYELEENIKNKKIDKEIKHTKNTTKHNKSTVIISGPDKNLPKNSKKIKKKKNLNKTNQQLGNNKPKNTKEIYTIPGESKNIPKNFTSALKKFILNHFNPSVQQNPQIMELLGTQQDRACKQTLENSINSCQLLKNIAQKFFGSLKWGTIFLEENKADLNAQFRFNQIWFESSN
ncbi:unnamed protein product [Paramecium octaurelia]|uniref:Uncharacterized protein n=1 Tax=Paramecium octaurelia TaxID=43137 RepID=A0A8S1W510_PAROT|nr:unnamed protein product [Paramecium octaurelia]